MYQWHHLILDYRNIQKKAVSGTIKCHPGLRILIIRNKRTVKIFTIHETFLAPGLKNSITDMVKCRVLFRQVDMKYFPNLSAGNVNLIGHWFAQLNKQTGFFIQ
jgi:hypothetical protein